jgi:hypothetical protein
MHKAIDLGKKFGDDIEMTSIKDLEDKTHYPDFYISGTDDSRLLDMPDEGEATIRFKVVSRTHSEDTRNGKKKRRCSLCIEVHSIEPPESKKKNGKPYGESARSSFADYFKDK